MMINHFNDAVYEGWRVEGIERDNDDIVWIGADGKHQDIVLYASRGHLGDGDTERRTQLHLAVAVCLIGLGHIFHRNGIDSKRHPMEQYPAASGVGEQVSPIDRDKHVRQDETYQHHGQIYKLRVDEHGQYQRYHHRHTERPPGIAPEP